MQTSTISPSPRLNFQPFSRNGWHGYVLDEWKDFPGFRDLDRWLASDEGTHVLDTHCRTILRQGTPKGVIYSKLMRAQNDGVILKHERFSKFKWICYPSRAICILKTTAAMLATGHHCPLPILGVRRRTAWNAMPQDLYVATEIPDPTVEDRLLKAADTEQRLSILAICGKELAKFHRDGFVHGDFLPRNTCLAPDDTRFSYLDNDRTRRWPNTPVFHFKRRNLTQFCFNLYVLGFKDQRELPDAFLKAYAQEANWSQTRLERETKTIVRQNERRWEQARQAKLKREQSNH